MMRNGQRHRAWAAAFCLATLAWVGCGANGTSSARLDAQSGPVISGSICAPGGQFAALPSWWLSFWPSAYAQTAGSCMFTLPSEAPITSVQNVSLSSLDRDAANHGCPPQLACAQLITNATSNPDGTYEVMHPALSNLDSSPRMILQIGGGDLLTRAFLFTRANASDRHFDIDAVSEAMVRLVLNRLAASTLTLDSFTGTGLNYLECLAYTIADASSPSDIDVFDVNASVYDTLAASGTIQQALDCITGTQSKCIIVAGCPPPPM